MMHGNLSRILGLARGAYSLGIQRCQRWDARRFPRRCCDNAPRSIAQSIAQSIAHAQPIRRDRSRNRSRIAQRMRNVCAGRSSLTLLVLLKTILSVGFRVSLICAEGSLHIVQAMMRASITSAVAVLAAACAIGPNGSTEQALTGTATIKSKLECTRLTHKRHRMDAE